MADIELVIKIPEESYIALMEIKDALQRMAGFEKFIVNGTPLHKGHGGLKDMGNLPYVFDLTREDPIYSGKDIERTIKSMKTIIEADKEGAEWVDDKCSACGKGIEDLIESPEWYQNEIPKYCPFCGIKIQTESEE
ncbi:MAG: hypothetical protein IJ880_16355 [Bacilli bacterium]|nr:hypothetical protein [Bacilli bacterium]